MSGSTSFYVFGNTDEKPQTKIQTINEIPKIESTEIPSWIKNNAKWWSEGIIGDSDFISGIKFLIEHDIIIMPETAQEQSKSSEIPSWIKNNAKWWSEGAIADSDFVSGIQYLVRNGIMKVSPDTESTLVQSNSTVKNNAVQVSSGAIQLNNYRFEKSPHHEINVEVSGIVADSKSGTYVTLTITKPDQVSYDLKGIITKKGEFAVPLMLAANSLRGEYVVTAKYDNVEIGVASFNVE
ncbi:MAG: putative phage head-tail adaptor (modular protein) [Candidatus Nitrosotenuis sp.]|nr:putative phage head-tail adaptor (modular protein) [Candidatus Nitrosotenuis sp.]